MPANLKPATIPIGPNTAPDIRPVVSGINVDLSADALKGIIEEIIDHNGYSKEQCIPVRGVAFPSQCPRELSRCGLQSS